MFFPWTCPCLRSNSAPSSACGAFAPAPWESHFGGWGNHGGNQGNHGDVAFHGFLAECWWLF